MTSSYSAIDFDLIAALLPWVPHGPVLDIGCGSGVLAAYISNYGFNVSALDADAQTLAQAKKSSRSSVAWHLQDIRKFELEPETWAAIICLNVFPFIPQLEHAELFERMQQALKPGGLLILSGFGANDPGAQAQFAQSQLGEISDTGLFDLPSLQACFRRWRFLHQFDGEIEDAHPPTGKHMHHLVQCIVQKPRAPQKSFHWSGLPALGAGIGWRPQLKEVIHPDSVDFLEIMLDDYTHPRYDRHLLSLSQKYQIIPHGVELSVGTPQSPAANYLADIQRIVERCNSPWWSDHLCYTVSSQYKSYSLNPLPMTEEALETVIANIKCAYTQVHRPLILENVAYYARPSHAEMSDAEFLKRMAEDADCGILLDVANLYGNAVNLKLDPYEFIQALPGERVVQIHLAGGRMFENLLFDTHDRAVWKETWELLHFALKHCDIKAISLERDANYNDLQKIIQEVAHARVLLGARQ